MNYLIEKRIWLFYSIIRLIFWSVICQNTENAHHNFLEGMTSNALFRATNSSKDIHFTVREKQQILIWEAWTRDWLAFMDYQSC